MNLIKMKGECLLEKQNGQKEEFVHHSASWVCLFIMSLRISILKTSLRSFHQHNHPQFNSIPTTIPSFRGQN